MLSCISPIFFIEDTSLVLTSYMIVKTLYYLTVPPFLAIASRICLSSSAMILSSVVYTPVRSRVSRSSMRRVMWSSSGSSWSTGSGISVSPWLDFPNSASFSLWKKGEIVSLSTINHVQYRNSSKQTSFSIMAQVGIFCIPKALFTLYFSDRFSSPFKNGLYAFLWYCWLIALKRSKVLLTKKVQKRYVWTRSQYKNKLGIVISNINFNSIHHKFIL